MPCRKLGWDGHCLYLQGKVCDLRKITYDLWKIFCLPNTFGLLCCKASSSYGGTYKWMDSVALSIALEIRGAAQKIWPVTNYCSDTLVNTSCESLTSASVERELSLCVTDLAFCANCVCKEPLKTGNRCAVNCLLWQDVVHINLCENWSAEKTCLKIDITKIIVQLLVMASTRYCENVGIPRQHFANAYVRKPKNAFVYETQHANVPAQCEWSKRVFQKCLTFINGQFL